MNTTTQDLAGREAPSIRYRNVAEPTVVGSDGRVGTEAVERPAVLRWLTWGIFGVVVATWALIGAVVWIPLLLRAMVRFTGALIEATLDGERPTHAAATLQGAVDFYRRGFVLAYEAVHGPTLTAGRPKRVQGRRLTREFLWAAAIWYAILAFVGTVPGPVDLWVQVSSLPWGEWADQVGAWITEPFMGDAPATPAAPPAEVVPPTTG